MDVEVLALLAAPVLVTVAFAPLPLPQALERLSAATGERLECAPTLRDEPLMLRLRAADEARVLQEIADLYDARWERRGDRRVLLPDAKARAKRERAVADASAATLRGSVAYLRRRLAAQPEGYGFAQAAAQAEKKARDEAAKKRALEMEDFANAFTASSADEETPAWRAASRIIPLLSEAELLALPNDSRTVWAERPTRAQRAFPDEASDALRRYRAELAFAKPETTVARVRLVMNRWEQGGAFNATLQAVDRAGGVVDTASLRMNDDTERMNRRSTVFDPPRPRQGETPLQVPEEVREYGEVVGEREVSPRRAAIRRKWLPILADPVRNEPTRWLPGMKLLAAAEALDENLVAAPGELPRGKYDKALQNETASQYVHGLAGLKERDGWLLLRDPEAIPRRSRAEARTLIQSSLAQGGVAFDPAAAWASANDAAFPFIDWVGIHLGVLFPDAQSTIGDRYGLRLWNALGAPARDALRAGRTLSLNVLPPAGQDWTARIAYWFNGIGNGEPTEILPNGIDGGTVTLTVKETPLVVASSSALPDASPSMPLTAEGLGRVLAKGDPYREIKPETFRAYDRYRMGFSRASTLHFVLGHEGVPMEYELDETFFDPNGPTLDAFPEAFAKAVATARAKATQP